MNNNLQKILQVLQENVVDKKEYEEYIKALTEDLERKDCNLMIEAEEESIFVIKHSYILDNCSNQLDLYPCKTKEKCLAVIDKLTEEIDYWKTTNHKFEIEKCNIQ